MPDRQTEHENRTVQNGPMKDAAAGFSCLPGMLAATTLPTRGNRWGRWFASLPRLDGMDFVILALSALWIGYLCWEKHRARHDRQALRHVICVNGTRGKSTVSRMIAAGLKAGGIKVFCKTTGTDPLTIDPEGTERPIRRRGPSNIKEQLWTLRRAAACHAEVLVAECMAITPEMQRVTQRDMLRSDIGVITNVRQDHTDVMGPTLDTICDALCNTLPENGVLYTAETALADRLKANCEKVSCRFVQALPDGTEPAIDFAENAALALAVCLELGVSREDARRGILNFRPDPYALSVYSLGEGIFINGLSINDIDSIRRDYDMLENKLSLKGKKLTLVINNRLDRGARTRDMALLCEKMKPERVIACGSGIRYLQMRLRRNCRDTEFVPLHRAEKLDPKAVKAEDVLFAVGNLAHEGRKLMEKVEKEGKRIV